MQQDKISGWLLLTLGVFTLGTPSTSCSSGRRCCRKTWSSPASIQTPFRNNS